MRTSISLLPFLFVGCASATPQTVSFYGFGNARSVAANRARSGLAGVLEPKSIAFTYSQSKGRTSFSAKRTGQLQRARVIYQTVPGGVLAVASASRSDKARTAFSRLTTFEANALVAHPNLARAILLAERKLLLRMVEGSLPQGTIVARGRISLRNVDTSISTGRVHLRGSGYVHIEHQRARTQLARNP